jgi:predicted small lipoprotein YifL
MSFCPRPFHLLSLAVAGALALGLAGCGVKGPLEPPPSSGIRDPAPEDRSATLAPQTGPAGANILGQAPAPSNIARGTTSAAVTQAPAAQEPSVLVWLFK